MLKEAREDNRENDAEHMRPVCHARRDDGHRANITLEAVKVCLFVVIMCAKNIPEYGMSIFYVDTTSFVPAVLVRKKSDDNRSI